MAEKWEHQLINLEEAVVDYVRTIPRSDRHAVIRRLHERLTRLERVVEGSMTSNKSLWDAFRSPSRRIWLEARIQSKSFGFGG